MPPRPQNIHTAAWRPQTWSLVILRFQMFGAVMNRPAFPSLTLSCRSLCDHTQRIDGEQRRAEVSLESSWLTGRQRGRETEDRSGRTRRRRNVTWDRKNTKTKNNLRVIVRLYLWFHLGERAYSMWWESGCSFTFTAPVNLPTNYTDANILRHRVCCAHPLNVCSHSYNICACIEIQAFTTETCS